VHQYAIWLQDLFRVTRNLTTKFLQCVQQFAKPVQMSAGSIRLSIADVVLKYAGDVPNFVRRSKSIIIKMKIMKKKQVISSDDPNENEKKFPGYPHYDQGEDIMSDAAKEERVELNLDETSSQIKSRDIPVNRSARSKNPEQNAADDIIVPGNDADVSEAEKEALANEGELQDLNYSPGDLDVPGSELDDASENIGSEDEENNYYSLGGDDKENLEES
jgi:hypothetical protein